MKVLFVATLLFAGGNAFAQEAPTSFGDRQLAQLLDDRPSMKGILSSDDTVVRWVRRKFETGDRGERVYWDHRNPYSGRDAEHSAGLETVPAFIRITDSMEVSGRDKWYMVVYEFENLENAVQFEQLQRLACTNQISREEFAAQCIQLEFQAGERTKRYFQRYPIPGAEINNAPEYTNRVSGNGDFEAYMAMIESLDGGYDPRKYFGDWYDRCKMYGELQRISGYASRTRELHGSGGGRAFRRGRSTPATP